MASAEQYAAWIVANADKKGTPEFDTVARAYQAARSMQAQPAPAPQQPSAPLPDLTKDIAEAQKQLQARQAELQRIQKSTGTSPVPAIAQAMRGPLDTAANQVRLAQADLDALIKRQQYQQQTGKAAPHLGVAGGALEALKAVPRGAIRSGAQFAGLLGALPGTGGEETTKAIEAGGENLIKNLGLTADEEALQFTPTAQRVSQLGEGVGSIVPFLLTEGAGAVAEGALGARELATAAKVARGAKTAANVALGTGQGAVQARQQVEDYEQQTGKPVDPTTRHLVQLGGGLIGLTEIIPIEGMIARLPEGLRATATAKLTNIAMKTGVGKLAPEAARVAMREALENIESKAVGRIAMRGAEEALQEGGSQLAQNIQERLAYNDEKDVSDGVAENAALGFVVGAGVRGASDAAQKLFPGKKGGIDQEAIRQQLLKHPALASIDALIPDPNNPKVATRGTLDILSAPNEEGMVVVRYGDGLLKRMHVDDVEALRVPEGAYIPSDSFSQENIGERLDLAVGDTTNVAAKSAASALALKLHTDLTLGRPQAAADYITKQQERISGVRRKQSQMQMAEGGIDAVTDPQMRVILTAQSILNDYRVEFAKAQAQPGVTVGETPSSATTLAQMLERNQAARAQSADVRRDLLKQIASDPNIANKVTAFDDVLANHGLDAITPTERSTLMDIMRMESAQETAEGADVTQSLKAQQTQRMDLIESVLGRRNFNADQKVSMINAELLRARQEPLNEDEEDRVYKRAASEGVFGPGGEFTPIEEPQGNIQTQPAADTTQVPSIADTAQIPPVKAKTAPAPAIDEAYAQSIAQAADEGSAPPASPAQAAPEDITGPSGLTAVQLGRPVEGAAELTAGMQDEQELHKRLLVMRNNNLLSDADVAEVMNLVRVPTTQADLAAMPPSQRARWVEAYDLHRDMQQKAEQRDTTDNVKQKKKLNAAIEKLMGRADEVRSKIAKYAQNEAAIRVAKRNLTRTKIEEDYKAGEITKAERDIKLRELRVQKPIGTVLSLRTDSASELLTNPDADAEALANTSPADIATGTDEIIAAIKQAVADGKMTQEAADFATWVLENNPNVAKFASLFVSNYTGQGYAGQYSPIDRLIEVVSGAPTGTTVHEVLHHAERLMPEAAQAGISRLWESRLNLRRRFAQGDEKAFFDAIHDYYFGSGDIRKLQSAKLAVSMRLVPRSFYQYMSPSEFWAENATDILRQRYDVKDSVLGRIRQWLKEFASHLGNFVALPTRSRIISQLNQLANTDGHSKSDALIVGNEGPAFMYGGSEREEKVSRPKGKEAEFTPNELFDMLGDLGTNPNRPRVDTVGTLAQLQKTMKGAIPSQSAIIRKLNYRYQDAVDFDKLLADAYGVERIPDNMSVATKAELHEAQKSGAHLAVDRTYVKPILQKMADLGVELQDIGMYLWARGAKDRNALVASRNGLYPDGGSGLTEVEANNILRDFAMRGMTHKLDQIAKMHDNLVDHMLNLRVREGLLTRKEANAQRAAQPFYAALKGWAADGDMQTEGDEEVHSDTAFHKNLGIKRAEFMRLEGRRSMPMNPLVNLFGDAHQLVQREAVNRVGKAFLDNLINDPELLSDVATYYTDSDPKIRVKRGPEITQPEGIPVRTNMRMERGKYLVVKKNGVPYYIEFANTDAGRAMKRLFSNMSPDKLSKGWKMIVRTANFLKSLKTRYAPGFIPRAYMRDAQDAVANAYAAETDNSSPAFGHKLGAKVAAYMTPATKTGRLIDTSLTRHLAGMQPASDEQAEMMLLIDQMTEDGGAPGHAVIHNTELLIADAEKYLQRMKKLQAKDPVAFAKEGVKGVASVMDAASQFVDLRARMATYVAALEAGINREGAARLALSSSLDLTRRGEWAKTLDSLWFFMSPSIESARRMKRLAFNSSNGRKVIMAYMAIGALTSIWNMMMGSGDDDDDGKPNYLDLPDGVRQTSLVFMTGRKADDYIVVPFGFLLGFPAYVGQKMTEAASGVISDGAAAVSMVDAAKHIASAAVTTFAPVKPQGEDAQQLATSMVPNIAKPWADLGVNRNYFGTPIYQKQWDSDRAASTLGREDTGRAWKWLAKSLNEMTGGSGTAGAGMDYQPEAYRYLMEEYAGGTYRFGKDAVNFVAEDNKGDKSLAQRLPVVRGYVGKGSEFAPMNTYFQNTGSEFFRPALSSFVYQQRNDPEQFAKSQQRYPFEASDRVLSAYKESKAYLDELSRDRRADLSSASTPSERKRVIDAYREAQLKVYRAFNKEYNAAKREYESKH